MRILQLSFESLENATQLLGFILGSVVIVRAVPTIIVPQRIGKVTVWDTATRADSRPSAWSRNLSSRR
jgi:hypothetical protein